jgi:hypothetical protein
LKKLILFFVLTITSIVPLLAQDSLKVEPIVAERPGFTNPPQTLAKKQLQIESGFYYEADKIKNTNIKIDNFFYPTTLFRYGLIKNIELRLEVDYAGISTSSSSTDKVSLNGLNPVIVGAKFYLFEQKKARPEAAFVFGLTLPYIGKKEFRPMYVAPSLAFYFQNTLNRKWSIGYNAGMQWNGNDAVPTSFLTFSPTYNFSKKVAGSLEIYSYFSDTQVPDFRLDAGLAYIPLPNLQIDIYGGPGLSGPTTNFFISAGISLRLPK